LCMLDDTQGEWNNWKLKRLSFWKRNWSDLVSRIACIRSRPDSAFDAPFRSRSLQWWILIGHEHACHYAEFGFEGCMPSCTCILPFTVIVIFTGSYYYGS
jgi:hypothetical protein